MKAGRYEVWKFKLPVGLGRSGQFSIPEPGTIVHVGLDPSGVACLWAIVRPSAPPPEWKLRTFLIVPTGAPGFVDGLDYVGTFFEGPFVWHLFEQGKSDGES